VDRRALVRLTGMITLRLWVTALVTGLLGGGLVWLGARPGLALMTVGALLVPVAVVTTLARLLRQPADTVPRWLTLFGGVGSAVGLVWLLVSPGHVPAIPVFAVGVWLLVVGLISAALVGRVRGS
jgi:drug/metabolite transporter superfamily protein YnfA